MRIQIPIITGTVFLLFGMARSEGQKPVSRPGPGMVFYYTAKKFGIPILKASIRIGNGPSGDGRSYYQVRAEITSVNLGFLFRINNRFTSIVDSETCAPIRYVKEIDQDGLFSEKKHYRQTLTFDPAQRKVIVEKHGEKEKQEILLPPETFDPLSMFARCYLKEALQPDQEIRMSIYDGVRLRRLVFSPRNERIHSKVFGEVEAVRIESTTSFASFEDREGTIRIWYTKDGKKTPLLMELDLPVGSLRFELDEMKEG